MALMFVIMALRPNENIFSVCPYIVLDTSSIASPQFTAWLVKKPKVLRSASQNMNSFACEYRVGSVVRSLSAGGG